LKTYCIIPARGRSKRIPYKNIAKINGIPLLEWTIKHSLESDEIKKTYVSTDALYIKDLAEKCGAIVIDRPSELCTDTSQSEEAVNHWLDVLGNDKPDIIVMMQCTAPFRETSQIDTGIRKLIYEKADSLFFASELGKWIWSNDNKPLNYDYKKRIMTQEKEWELIECSDYIFTYDLFKKTGLRLGGKIINQKVSKYVAIDVDDNIDLVVARSVAKYLNLKP
jgi:N-acylneuraminate cytidylyltransferase